jgi:hypothetical protein
MNVTYTLGFFCGNFFCGSFCAKCAIDERSALSTHFHFLLLIVVEGGNSRQVRPAHRPAHVRGSLFPEPFRRSVELIETR